MSDTGAPAETPAEPLTAAETAEELPEVEVSPAEEIALAAGFPPQTHERWQELVAGVVNRSRAEDARLSGADAEDTLRSHLPGGLTIDPLYLRPAEARPLGVPGAMPFTRGRAMRDADVPWDVRQLHDDPEVGLTRAAVLDDLEHGVTSVWLHVGTDGLPAADVEEALADVQLDLAPVVVSSVDAQTEAATILREILEGSADATGNLGLDPIGAAARLGAAPDLDGLARALVGLDPERIRAITVDARVYRDAGATAIEEIGYAVATGLAYVRHLAGAGIAPAESFPHIEFRVSVDADQFLGIAALRALPRLWARVGEVLEVPEADRGARIHAVTALRMFTRDDPWVNILRSTIATFAASAGGADAITVLPYDTVAGLPEKFSRRLARNTQIVLADESNIGRVTDPAGGSWYVEDLTDDVANAAWTVLQEVEAAGGMVSALSDGLVERRLETARKESDRRLATREQPITGVSMFPKIDETALDRRARTSVSDQGLVPRRDSAVFEALRDRASANAPTVVVAALGSRRDFGARETFISNLLGVAGISTQTIEGDADAFLAAVKSVGTTVVALASSPKGYAEHAADVIAALRDGGVETIIVAGRARELGDAADRVDLEAYQGADVVALLGDVLDRLSPRKEGGDR
ncbi:MAG: methylmalonyl-CoA mutase small subunit [Intrasporangiaceae bacterium]|nr:methylmalonyl-CoA mutase small subunit [Intrasporangiaceae bacterium]